MKKLSLCILLFSTLFISSEDISMDEMVDFIVKEQFLSQQEDTMTNAMGTMLQTIGMDIKSIKYCLWKNKWRLYGRPRTCAFAPSRFNCLKYVKVFFFLYKLNEMNIKMWNE